ncbi:fascin domain-containing protein [Chromobacterium alticapitis]|uniref:Ricin B lectin domain-containing protein n=1 Tax=Chromobacterium alticapitis TaxID=2073169 RepID=A0A2S5DA53_9NEIS|nr:hypothetical protein [Chromobacterium alticapitis]POZ59980.1 hypothetical protein C2I19_21370 [Chromobacterium alticapitis]
MNLKAFKIMFAAAALAVASAASHAAPIVTLSSPLALQTSNGHYLTAVNGGGLGGPNSGPYAVALHSDAKAKGAWETLYLVQLANGRVAFRTTTGYYLTAINGGGMGGPNSSASPFHTDATWASAWERFQLEFDPASNTYALKTANGNYVTFVNNGGIGGANNVPVHSDARAANDWESFTLVPLNN